MEESDDHSGTGWIKRTGRTYRTYTSLLKEGGSGRQQLQYLLSGPEGPEPALGTTLGRLSK